MVSCENHQSAIVALFDNEAKDEDLRLAAAHLHECPDCRTFCLDLIGIRRTVTSASVPSLSPTARQQVLDSVKADSQNAYRNDSPRAMSIPRLGRWAAILVIGVLSITCFTLDRTAHDLRTRLGAAEQEAAAIRAQEEQAEAEERQRKAISALYFRMAELEERFSRAGRPESAFLQTPVYNRSEGDNNL